MNSSLGIKSENPAGYKVSDSADCLVEASIVHAYRNHTLFQADYNRLKLIFSLHERLKNRPEDAAELIGIRTLNAQLVEFGNTLVALDLSGIPEWGSETTNPESLRLVKEGIAVLVDLKQTLSLLDTASIRGVSYARICALISDIDLQSLLDDSDIRANRSIASLKLVNEVCPTIERMLVDRNTAQKFLLGIL